MPIKTQIDEQPSLNLTPMIDIVFLLIIFFMVGTKFTELERNIELNLPKVADAGALTAAPDKKVINVFESGELMMDNERLEIKQLKSKLEDAVAEYQDLGVVIRGDAQGPLQNVATVLTACKAAGINDMGISVRLESLKR